jgi:hypothetical protein
LSGGDFVKIQSIFYVVPAVFTIVSSVSAGPISTCANHVGDSGFTCNIYETLADGTPSDASNTFSFPTAQSVSSGYIVLMDAPGADQTDSTQWSDVLHFIDDGLGQATTGQLLSIGCNCYPTYAQVTAVAHLFMLETQVGTGNDFLDSTPYVTGFNTFNIFSASPDPVPEPASFALMGSSLLITLACVRFKKYRSAIHVPVARG